MTIRRDLEDPDTLEFRSRVRARRRREGRHEILLEETYFYPESGGQEADRGTLSGVPVVDVRLEGGEVVHVTSRDVEGEWVEGRIDGERRLDHRRQHTGQHILSRAFLDVAGAPTVSAHLGARECTIDVRLDDPDPARVERVEAYAQRAVHADVPVRLHFFEAGEAIPFELRREPGEYRTVRVVEIEGIDATPCGGTHCRRSGDVGVVKILAAERYKKGLCRITFVCGDRALEDYRRKHRIVRSLVRLLMSPEDEVVPGAVKLVERLEEASKRERSLWREIVAARARTLLDEAPPARGVRVVRHVALDLPADLAGDLARASAEGGGCVAIVGIPGEPAAIAVAASEGTTARPVGETLREVLQGLGGKGGGGPTFARGALPGTHLEEAIQRLAARVAAASSGELNER